MDGAGKTGKSKMRNTVQQSSVGVPAGQLKEKTPLLPDSWVLFFKNQAFRSLGLFLFLLAGLLVVTIMYHDPADPTWNRATDQAVNHPLGTVGAIVADILLQTLGLAAWALIPPLVMWGQKIIRLRWLPYFWFNLSMIPVGVVMIALALAVIPPSADFVVQAGYGGALGQVLYRQLIDLLGATVILPSWAYIAFFLTLGLPLYAMSFALRRDEWHAIGSFIMRTVRAVVRAVIRAFVTVVSAVIGMVQNAIAARQAKKAQSEPRYVREPVMYDDEEDEEEEGYQDEQRPDADPDEDVEDIDAEPVGDDDQAAEKKSRFRISLRRARKEEPAEEDEPVEVRVRARSKTKRGKREIAESQSVLPILAGYQLPTLDLLMLPDPKKAKTEISDDALEQNAHLLMEVLEDFSVSGEIRDVRPGPVVTLYELEPARGTKSSRVIGLADDIARSMSAISARIAVVPGRNAIGIELPNLKRETVFLRELLASKDYETSRAKLAIALGKDIGGSPVIADLATMPHLLVAGTTGSGKSVGINTMILSMIYKHTPETLRLIMIDPKMLELSVYDDIPHLLTPVVTDPKKAVVALKWAVREMEERYANMSKIKVRNMAAFNKKVLEAKAKGVPLTRPIQNGYDPETNEPIIEEEVLDFEPLPFIVVVIDEMADLMIVAGKDVEATVQRLAQMARAAGIHLIMATQRPSVDVITGTIKANFPTRISFQVTSKIDSRTILNEQGAEQLLGKGDMLYMASGARVTRVHGAFVDDGEVEDVVSHLKDQAKPDYLDAVTEEPAEGFDSPFIPGPSDAGDKENSLYDQAVAIVLRDRKASTSYIQRRLQIGYNKAATLIEQMESQGVISQPDHKNKREILVPERPEQDY